MDQRKLLIYLTSLLPTQNDADDVFQEASMVLWKEFEKFELFATGLGMFNVSQSDQHVAVIGSVQNCTWKKSSIATMEMASP